MLTLVVDGTSFQCPLKELHHWTGASYTTHLSFEEASIQEKIEKKASVYANSLEAIEQRWLGTYFHREILNPPTEPFELRWINREIGWGLFAKTPLKKGAFIATYTGEVRRRRRTDEKNSYCFQYLVPVLASPYLLIDAKEGGSLGRYLNHDKEGNVETRLVFLDGIYSILLSTARPIAAGEELCYDYGPDYWKKRPPPQRVSAK